jgi:HEPN domain-containing protein
MADKSLLADWIRHAANDLIVARHLFEDLRPMQTEIAAYEANQCAEKSLKAFLYANDLDFPKTHDLIKLVHLCKDIDGSFTEVEMYCSRLNPYGSISRYPNELVVDETIVKAIIERAQKIYDFCMAKITTMNGEKNEN